jgi:hypothetical protein
VILAKDAITVSVSPSSVSEGFVVSGTVTAASGNVQLTAVFVRVANPKAKVVAVGSASVSGSGASGTFALSFRAGGNEDWVNGKYEVVGTYGTYPETSLSKSSAYFTYEGETGPRHQITSIAHEPTKEELAKSLIDQSPDQLSTSLGWALFSMGELQRSNVLQKVLYPDGIPPRYPTAGLAISPSQIRKALIEYLKKFWPSLLNEACEWAKTAVTLALGTPAVMSLGSAIARVLPPEVAGADFVVYAIATLLLRAGIGALCAEKPPAPPVF